LKLRFYVFLAKDPQQFDPQLKIRSILWSGGTETACWGSGVFFTASGSVWTAAKSGWCTMALLLSALGASQYCLSRMRGPLAK
jgi:hypothetical protein